MTTTHKLILGGFGIALLGAILAIALLPDRTPAPERAPVATTPTISAPAAPVPFATSTVIGYSVNGRAIEAYRIGTGTRPLLFVGGIHGGYEWNSILLAYEMIDYYQADPTRVPSEVALDIIPNLNPDGLYEATGLTGRFTAADIPNTDMHRTGAGRFNANDVDLNRNFDCKWEPQSTWRGQTVSAGTAPFSEPEAAALRDYVFDIVPEAAVFWHSRANNVYASECEDGVLPETLVLMDTYANAGNYGAVPVFDAYPITGDAEGWLASLGIPAVTVELETRTSVEWQRNLAGTEAIITQYAK